MYSTSSRDDIKYVTLSHRELQRRETGDNFSQISSSSSAEDDFEISRCTVREEDEGLVGIHFIRHCQFQVSES